MSDSPEAIARDIQTIARISAVPMLLKIVSETTGMGYAAVARVSAGHWTACAVHDAIGFNLPAGGELDVTTTLCHEVREARAPIVIGNVAADPVYADHPTPRRYGFQSYVSVAIVLSDGEYFGNLCAIDLRPAELVRESTLAMFNSFAQLIAMQLEAERAREQTLAALLDERTAGQLREQFIAVLSHDLRSPLAAVVACGQALEHVAVDPPTVRQLGQRINRSCRRMSGLIDDTLDFARGRLGGGIALDTHRIGDIGELLQAVVAEIVTAQPQRRIEVDIEAGTPAVGDPGRLQQLLSNLLLNALHHGSQTEPITLRAGSDGADFVLSVHNHGEPISAEHQRQIFSPFWRNATSPAREGLGLGLYICAQIVQAHGGTLAVVSTPEAGTTFTARLPRRG